MTRLRWVRDGRTFEAREPDAATVRTHVTRLRAWYNDASNAAMMGNETSMTDDDVLGYWADVPARSARGFLLFVDDALVGDAELRNVHDDVAEFSIMIGPHEGQGRGLGSTFAAIVHVFAFRELGLARVYVQPKPENVRVQKLERRLGYEPDDSPRARSFADDEDAITMSITAAAFAARNATALAEVVSED